MQFYEQHTVYSIEEQARRLAVACMRHGAAATGEPVAAVGELYRMLCFVLQNVQTSGGPEAMLTAATLAHSAIETGIIYVGEETYSFIQRIGDEARITHRDVLDDPPDRFRSPDHF